MKKKFVYCLLLFCAFIFQVSVLPLFSPLFAMGDLLLMFVLAGAIIDGFFEFLWWAIFAGVIYDLISYTSIGVHALIFLSVVYFVSFFSRRFSVELRGFGLFLFLLFVVFATVVSRLIIALSVAWDLHDMGVVGSNFGNFHILIIQILFNIVLFFLSFIMLKRTKSFFAID